MAGEIQISARKKRKRGSTSKLPDGYQPGPTDVICAKGKRAFNHNGNVCFRSTIESFQEAYALAVTKVDKTSIVTQILDSVKCANPPGRFIREDPSGGWSQLGDAAAREKVGAGFRDLLHLSYKSSGKRKRQRRIEAKKAGSADGGEKKRRESAASQASKLNPSKPSPDKSCAETHEHTNELRPTPVMFEDAFSGRIRVPTEFDAAELVFEEDGRISKEYNGAGKQSEIKLLQHDEQTLAPDPLSAEPALLASMMLPGSSPGALPSAQSLVQSVFEGTSGEGESSEEDQKPSAI